MTKILVKKIFRERFPHKGVVLLRLKDERADNKISVIRKLIGEYSKELDNKFVVVTEKQIRFSAM